MGPNEILDKGFIIDEPVDVFLVVTQSAVDHAELASAGGDWVGILQEGVDALDVSNRRVARVRVEGVSRGVAATALTINTKVTADATGRLVAAASTNNVVGIVRSPAAVAGDWVNVQLTPGVVLA